MNYKLIDCAYHKKILKKLKYLNKINSFRLHSLPFLRDERITKIWKIFLNIIQDNEILV